MCSGTGSSRTRPTWSATDPDVALIDEADSILIDEALVPLVLAGPSGDAQADPAMAEIVRGLVHGLHYEIDDEGRNATLTSEGGHAAEEALGGINLYAADQLDTLTQLNVALHAHALLQRDVDYIVRDGQVHLISASRGRVAQLQRWPDGLQAAVEAKEALAATESGEILDSITIESLVRRYPQVCGMTGTAVTVGEELREFYGLEVAVIPPNRPCVREDQPDRLYAKQRQKEKSIVAEVTAAHVAGRPVLIGTLDIAESERIGRSLAAAGLPHVVLNAKNDAQEAAIVAEAGSRGAITVSTQMAGRGTDIRLGGPRRQRRGPRRGRALGGLYVIGTGRHASSRLDNQLRGRSGRQGDPGGSVFFVSLEDELITAYAPDSRGTARRGRQTAGSATLGRDAAVAHAQRVADGANLQIHRNTFRFNKLIEEQRRVVLEHRDRMLRTDAADLALASRCPERHAELTAALGPERASRAARQIVLYHLDRGWADHLATLAGIREGIHLRALGHGPNPFVMALDPLAEFHAEAVKLFAQLLEQVEERSAETFRTAAITSAGRRPRRRRAEDGPAPPGRTSCRTTRSAPASTARCAASARPAAADLGTGPPAITIGAGGHDPGEAMTAVTETSAGCPHSQIDPFCDDFLADPFGYLTELRETGPVVCLDRYGVYAVTRHEHVQAVLKNPGVFSSAAGVGLTHFGKDKAWRKPSILLEVDPPVHTHNRRVVARALAPRSLAYLQEIFDRRAAELADDLVSLWLLRRRAGPG